MSWRLCSAALLTLTLAPCHQVVGELRTCSAYHQLQPITPSSNTSSSSSSGSLPQPYVMRMTVLGSRELYCVHPKVRRSKNKNEVTWSASVLHHGPRTLLLIPIALSFMYRTVASC